jgi:hypothetical protein
MQTLSDGTEVPTHNISNLPEYTEAVILSARDYGIKELNSRDRRVIQQCHAARVTVDACASVLRPVVHTNTPTVRPSTFT